MNFLSVLTLIFITLKLMEYIDWSWWFVLSPLLIQVTMMLSTIIGLIIYAVRKK